MSPLGQITAAFLLLSFLVVGNKVQQPTEPAMHIELTTQKSKVKLYKTNISISFWAVS